MLARSLVFSRLFQGIQVSSLSLVHEETEYRLHACPALV